MFFYVFWFFRLWTKLKKIFRFYRIYFTNCTNSWKMFGISFYFLTFRGDARLEDINKFFFYYRGNFGALKQFCFSNQSTPQQHKIVVLFGESTWISSKNRIWLVIQVYFVTYDKLCVYLHSLSLHSLVFLIKMLTISTKIGLNTYPYNFIIKIIYRELKNSTRKII